MYLDSRYIQIIDISHTHTWWQILGFLVDILYIIVLVFVDGNNSILSSTVHREAQHIDIDTEGGYSFRFTVNDKAFKSVETDN